MDGLNGWLAPMFDAALELQVDMDSISALSLKREQQWERIGRADFLTDEEKRELLGIRV